MTDLVFSNLDIAAAIAETSAILKAEQSGFPPDCPFDGDICYLPQEQEATVAPFTIVVDVNEGAPYRFTGLPLNKSEGDGCWVVPTTKKALWAMGRMEITTDKGTFTKGLADYSIDGLESQFQVERKSLSDLYSTLGGKRDEFEAEISRLCCCQFAAVVVEASWDEALNHPPANSRLLPKTVESTILSWSIRYPQVHWFLVSDRRHGERTVFNLCHLFWRQWQHRKKELSDDTQ